MPTIRRTPFNPGGSLVEDPLDRIESDNRNAAMHAAEASNAASQNNAMAQLALARLKQSDYQFGQGQADRLSTFREGLAADNHANDLKYQLGNRGLDLDSQMMKSQNDYRQSQLNESHLRYQNQYDDAHRYQQYEDSALKDVFGSSPSGAAVPMGGYSNSTQASARLPGPVAPGAVDPGPVAPTATTGVGGGSTDKMQLRKLMVLAALKGGQGAGGIPDFDAMDRRERMDAEDDQDRGRERKRRKIGEDIASGHADLALGDAGGDPSLIPIQDPAATLTKYPEIQQTADAVRAKAKELAGTDFIGGGLKDNGAYVEMMKNLDNGVAQMKARGVDPAAARAYLMRQLQDLAPTESNGFEIGIGGVPIVTKGKSALYRTLHSNGEANY